MSGSRVLYGEPRAEEEPPTAVVAAHGLLRLRDKRVTLSVNV